MSKKRKQNEDYGYCREGAIPKIIINNASSLSVFEFKQVLIRIKKTIEDKIPLGKIDSNEIGNKFISCNWGLCSEQKEHYPNARLHTFPKNFNDSGRMSPLNLPHNYDCPMRLRRKSDPEWKNRSGCFYQCRVFNLEIKTPNNEEAIKLYNDAIDKITD